MFNLTFLDQAFNLWYTPCLSANGRKFKFRNSKIMKREKKASFLLLLHTHCRHSDTWLWSYINVYANVIKWGFSSFHNFFLFKLRVQMHSLRWIGIKFIFLIAICNSVSARLFYWPGQSYYSRCELSEMGKSNVNFVYCGEYQKTTYSSCTWTLKILKSCAFSRYRVWHISIWWRDQGHSRTSYPRCRSNHRGSRNSKWGRWWRNLRRRCREARINKINP